MENEISSNKIYSQKDLSPFEDKIIIPEGIEKIDSFTFAGNEKVKEIVLPSTLKYIGEEAFANCSRLKIIEIPEGVEDIGIRAFYNCPSLKFIKLPSTLSWIKYETFSRCESLEEIIIPEGIEKIDGSAFSSCLNLRKVFLPSTLRKFDCNAFNQCNSLNSLIIPEGVEEIYNVGFNDLKLDLLSLPRTLKSVNFTLLSCNRINEFYIPASKPITSINNPRILHSKISIVYKDYEELNKLLNDEQSCKSIKSYLDYSKSPSKKLNFIGPPLSIQESLSVSFALSFSDGYTFSSPDILQEKFATQVNNYTNNERLNFFLMEINKKSAFLPNSLKIIISKIIKDALMPAYHFRNCTNYQEPITSEGNDAYYRTSSILQNLISFLDKKKYYNKILGQIRDYKRFYEDIVNESNDELKRKERKKDLDEIQRKIVEIIKNSRLFSSSKKEIINKEIVNCFSSTVDEIESELILMIKNDISSEEYNNFTNMPNNTSNKYLANPSDYENAYKNLAFKIKSLADKIGKHKQNYQLFKDSLSIEKINENIKKPEEISNDDIASIIGSIKYILNEYPEGNEQQKESLENRLNLLISNYSQMFEKIGNLYYIEWDVDTKKYNFSEIENKLRIEIEQLLLDMRIIKIDKELKIKMDNNYYLNKKNRLLSDVNNCITIIKSDSLNDEEYLKEDKLGFVKDVHSLKIGYSNKKIVPLEEKNKIKADLLSILEKYKKIIETAIIDINTYEKVKELLTKELGSVFFKTIYFFSYSENYNKKV